MRATVAPSTATGTWTIDPATSVARFAMKYVLFATLKGTLGAIEGTLLLDEGDPTRSAVSASIAVASLDTGNRLRDRHLRSSDFFDAKRFPTITFQSTRVEKIESGVFRITGALTIRDITRKVELQTRFDEQFLDTDGSTPAHFIATATLSRRAFGLGRSAPAGAANAIASDNVTVTLDITAIEA